MLERKRRTTPSRPRRRKTNKLEFFETPPGFTRFLTKHVRIRGVVYGCTVGEGAIIRAMQEETDAPTRTYFTNDIDPARPADTHFDARTPEAWNFVIQPDWVVDNPPFSAAYAILVNGLRTARLGVILHLRVSFPEPTLDRETFLAEHPPDVMLYLPRYAFSVSPKTGKRGTDAVTTAWCVWLTDEGVMNTLYGRYWPIFQPDSPLMIGGGGTGRTRRILVAPRSVADEGWHDGQGQGSEGAGVPAQQPAAPTGEPA